VTDPGRPGGDDPATRRFLEGFRARHSPREVLEGLAALRALRVLVVGEAIVDEYSYCTPLGKASKAPVIAARHLRVERQAGGSVACANQVAGFCDEVHLVTCLGAEDPQERFIRERLRPNVTARCLVRAGAPTTTKRRYVSEPGPVKLFEVAVMDDTPLPADLEDALLGHLDRALPALDVVIAADYGHGLLGPRAAGLLAARAPFLAVNTQANPLNLGFNVATKYAHAHYVCLDEAEVRLATLDRWSPVRTLARTLCAQLGGSAISVTLGARGALARGPDGVEWEIPALARDVVDEVGAGDAYLAVTAPSVAAGLPMDVVGFLGAVVGGLAVGIVGNRTAVEPDAVRGAVAALLA
jgi:bifunctional ADP-heptose synthase (sugar kinase/adenylyltransferase)